jgi:cytochrome c oxidase subunit 4
VNIEDWSAISDTMHGVAVVSAVLLAITLALNIITLAKYRGR